MNLADNVLCITANAGGKMSKHTKWVTLIVGAFVLAGIVMGAIISIGSLWPIRTVQAQAATATPKVGAPVSCFSNWQSEGEVVGYLLGPCQVSAGFIQSNLPGVEQSMSFDVDTSNLPSGRAAWLEICNPTDTSLLDDLTSSSGIEISSTILKENRLLNKRTAVQIGTKFSFGRTCFVKILPRGITSWKITPVNEPKFLFSIAVYGIPEGAAPIDFAQAQ